MKFPKKFEEKLKIAYSQFCKIQKEPVPKEYTIDRFVLGILQKPVYELVSMADLEED